METNNNTNLQLNEQATPQIPSSPNRKSKLRQSVAAVLASAQTLVPSAATTAGLAGGTAMLTGCETEQVDPDNVLSQEEQLAKWHQEAEAEANRLGWSQGVKSLAAGEIDYYYYREKEGGPLLIRLSYQVDVNDFINKIETDAKNRGGIYDPKTGGMVQAYMSSLEGDGQTNVWLVPSQVIYDAKVAGKTSISFNLGEYPSPNPGQNTIKGGLNPNKQMQIYSGYGNKNLQKVEDVVNGPEKRGELKNIL